MDTAREVAKLRNEELLARVRTLVARSNETEALLIAHLAEVDARRLYLPRRTSLWDFCLYDLGFSENAAWNRITVARASRRFPQLLEVLRAGRIHLSGLKLLCPELTPENADALLADAAGKTKRQIEELLARRKPKPPVPDSIRKLPSVLPAEAPTAPTATMALALGSTPSLPAALPLPPPVPAAPAVELRTERASVAPLSGGAYLLKVTMRKSLHDKMRLAQDVSRHENPSGDVATILEEALDLYIEKKLKAKFAVGRRARTTAPVGGPATSRHVPAAIQRAVYERDGGRCTFVDTDGRRCDSRAFITLDHVEGFARTQEHRADKIRLLCASHNQHAADVLYGKTWMDERRRAGGEDDDSSGSHEQREVGPH